MKSLSALVLIVIIGGTASCGASRVAGECPETKRMPCVTERACAPEAGRDCMVCHCKSAEPSIEPYSGDERGLQPLPTR